MHKLVSGCLYRSTLRSVTNVCVSFAGRPRYDDDLDQFVHSDGEKLVPVCAAVEQAALDNPPGTGSLGRCYRFENEGRFMHFRRLPGGGWEAHTLDGTRHVLGEFSFDGSTVSEATLAKVKLRIMKGRIYK